MSQEELEAEDAGDEEILGFVNKKVRQLKSASRNFKNDKNDLMSSRKEIERLEHELSDTFQVPHKDKPPEEDARINSLILELQLLRNSCHDFKQIFKRDVLPWVKDSETVPASNPTRSDLGSLVDIEFENQTYLLTNLASVAAAIREYQVRFCSL